MTSRLARAILMVFAAVGLVSGYPSATARGALSQVEGQVSPAADLARHIDSLSAFDHDTRTLAARMLRRAEASQVTPALLAAVKSHSDQFVRYRALVLLTTFTDRGTADVLRTLVTDRNDRIREVAYRWFERHPDPTMSTSLLDALNTEQAEFVRPALIRAVAALPDEDRVRRALIAEAGRGLDFFRSAVLEALGERRADYAVDIIASIAANEGPLQDDAILALGRIGRPGAVSALAAVTKPSPEVAPALQAAKCLLGEECQARITSLADSARDPAARPETTRAAIAALGAVAAAGNAEATAALVALSRTFTTRLRDEAAVALGAVALRQPAGLVAWLAQTSDSLQMQSIELLREGFERLEEDFTEEQFFAAVRAAYWSAPEGSPTRTLTATLIDKLEF